MPRIIVLMNKMPLARFCAIALVARLSRIGSALKFRGVHRMTFRFSRHRLPAGEAAKSILELLGFDVNGMPEQSSDFFAARMRRVCPHFAMPCEQIGD